MVYLDDIHWEREQSKYSDLQNQGVEHGTFKIENNLKKQVRRQVFWKLKSVCKRKLYNCKGWYLRWIGLGGKNLQTTY